MLLITLVLELEGMGTKSNIWIVYYNLVERNGEEFIPRLRPNLSKSKISFKLIQKFLICELRILGIYFITHLYSYMCNSNNSRSCCSYRFYRVHRRDLRRPNTDESPTYGRILHMSRHVTAWSYPEYSRRFYSSQGNMIYILRTSRRR